MTSQGNSDQETVNPGSLVREKTGPEGEFKPREFRKDGDRERKPFDRERRPGGNGEFKPKREFKPRKREEGE